MILLVDFSNLVYSAFHSSLFGMKPEECPPYYQEHIFRFRDKLTEIINRTGCRDYYFVLDNKPIKKYKILPDYKKGRSKLPLDPKKPVLEMLKSWSARIIEAKDEEADDVFASFIHYNPDVPVTIASTDKDLWQLCENEKVRVFNFNDHTFADKDKLYKHFKLERFDHIPLYKALWGDSSDNVPNVAKRMKGNLLPVIKDSDGSLDDFFSKYDKANVTARCREIVDESKQKIRDNYQVVKLSEKCQFKIDYLR